MQTLVFNTKTKTVTVYEGQPEKSNIMYSFTDVPTVKVLNSHYEVMRKTFNGESDMTVPVARVPIANTNMLIQN